MAESSRKEDLKLLERLVSSGSGQISYVPGVSGASGNNELWRRFVRIRLDGRVCQAVKCKSCGLILPHRTGSTYDGSHGRSSGTSNLRKHACPKGACQPQITSLLRKEIREGALRAEKKVGGDRPQRRVR